MLYIGFCSPYKISYLERKMSKFLFVLNSIVAVAFGLLLVFAPEVGLSQFSMTARVQEIFMARAIGAALAALGAVLWFAKDADEALQKMFGYAALVGNVLGIIVTVIGVFCLDN